MTTPTATICGLGLLTPVGINTKQACAAIRAGVSAYEESAIYNKRFGPMTLALLPDDALPELNDALNAVPGMTSRQARMLRLAHPAMDEALAVLPADCTVPLFLAGPEAITGEKTSMGEAFLDHLLLQSGAPLDVSESVVFTYGRAGGLLAVKAALKYLATGRSDYVLVGGVDTYLDLRLLSALDQEDRVLAEGIMDGFAPGESAAFILLCATDDANSSRPAAGVTLHSPGLSKEPGHRYSEENYSGDGLANAAREALSAVSGKPVRVIYSSMNGENINGKEWGVTAARNTQALDPNYVLEHPADCVGDTGAASGPLLIAIAAESLRKKFTSGPVLVVCSSDGAERGAVCLGL